VLVAARVPAIGVSQGVADQHGQIGLVYVTVHQHRVAARRRAQIHQMLVVFAIMVDDLARAPKLGKERLTQHGRDLVRRVLAMQAVGADEEHVLAGYPGSLEFLDDQRDRHPAVRGGMLAPLDHIRKDNRHPVARPGQLSKRLHTDRVAQRLAGGGHRICQTRGVRDRFTRDEHIGVVRQVRLHHIQAIFQHHLHGQLLRQMALLTAIHRPCVPNRHRTHRIACRLITVKPKGTHPPAIDRGNPARASMPNGRPQAIRRSVEAYPSGLPSQANSA